jgi:UDP-glucose 4-epimerase
MEASRPVILPTRIAVTGASGYLGGRLVECLLGWPHVERVLALDVKPPQPPDDERFCFLAHDVCEPCADRLRQHAIDAVVHLAFCFAPARDRRLATRINVEGTRQVLASCLQAGVQTALYCSSATAYGALPDNPRLLREDHPLRAAPSFQYAYEKRLTDELWQAFAAENPELRVIICRPPVVVGPYMNNYLSRMLDKPISFALRGEPAPMQFIHEQDVAEGMAALLERGSGGVYNLSPPDTMTLQDVVVRFGRRLVHLPAWILIPLMHATYWLRLRWVNEVPGGFVGFVRYPWVVDASRVERELGWRCRYSTRQAVEAWAQAATAERS